MLEIHVGNFRKEVGKMKTYIVSLSLEREVEANNIAEAKEKAFDNGIGDTHTIMDNMEVEEK